MIYNPLDGFQEISTPPWIVETHYPFQVIFSEKEKSSSIFRLKATLTRPLLQLILKRKSYRGHIEPALLQFLAIQSSLYGQVEHTSSSQ